MSRRRWLFIATGAVAAGLVCVAPAAATHPPDAQTGRPCPADGHRTDTAVKQEADTPVDGLPNHVADVGRVGVYADQGYAAASLETRYLEVDGNKQNVEYSSFNPAWGANVNKDTPCAKIENVGV